MIPPDRSDDAVEGFGGWDVYLTCLYGTEETMSGLILFLALVVGLLGAERLVARGERV